MKINSSTELQAFLPSTSSSSFSRAIGLVGGAAQRMGSFLGDAGQSLVGSSLPGPYQDLLSAQTEAQMQLMQVSLQSNISRSTHESKMAVVRNIRVA